MKKRLTLTTLLIIVLLIVALSTATFAWFSANNTVNVTIISFSASASDNEGGELYISWDPEVTDGYSIDFKNGSDMSPMIPREAPVVGQSYASFITLGEGESMRANFISALQAYNEEDGEYYYVGSVLTETPYTIGSVDGSKDVFYLINGNADFGMKITVSYTIDGDLGTALCIALFAGDRLVGIMSNSDRIYYGEITSGGKVTDQTYITNAGGAAGEISFSLGAGEIEEMRLVAWYSGVDLDNNGAEKYAYLSTLKFSGAYEG